MSKAVSAAPRRGSIKNAKITEDAKAAAVEEVGKLRILFDEVPQEMSEYMLGIATQALLQLKKEGELEFYHQVAEVLKKDLDEHYGGTWHVIVGSHFGSFCTHEARRVFYFSLGSVNILIFGLG